MFSRIIHLLAIVLAATLEVSIALWLGEATPGFVFAVILALSLGGDVIDSLWWVALGGLLLDSMNGFAFGFYLLVFSLMSAGLIMLNRQILHRPPAGLAFFVFLVAAIVVQAIFVIMYGHLSWMMVGSTVVTTALATLFYRIILIVGRRREVITLE